MEDASAGLREPDESDERLLGRAPYSELTGFGKQLVAAERFTQVCFGAFLTLLSVCLMVFSALMIVFVAHKTLQPIKDKV